ncbi:MAG TPA: hypothetical protein VFY10_05915 [Dehalococcoidia bacterium]|nr:hypothetical protein [Dehalococcoidia bacterium]
MNTVYIDPACDESERRERLYDGQVFVLPPRPASLALVEFAREMLADAFGPVDPRLAQYEMPVEEYVAIVAPLKPRFIHDPRTIELIADITREAGCDLRTTYLDVPRLRAVTSDAYLTAGVGYAHPPHRDTWYSAPMCQLNWWMPVFDIESESSMAFHPDYWARPVLNSSADFNYYEWNRVGRRDAALQIKTDARKQPQLLEDLEMEPQIRLVVPPGGIVLFSAAQMHSTVPNTAGSARYSIDFRTVNLVDLLEGAGAANLDSDCSGTSLRDFRRGSSGEPLPDEVVVLYDDETLPLGGELVYRPPEVPTH